MNCLMQQAIVVSGDYMKELGAFIKAAREERALSIREAAELCGMSNAYLSQIENGKISRPSPETIRKISGLYQMPFEVLMEKAGYALPEYGFLPKYVPPSRITVLIVDDSPHDREIIVSHLERESARRYDVFFAGTGSEAVEQYRRCDPDCVLLDYRLPDMDGLAVFRKLKADDAGKDVSVIMLTGYGNEETAVQAMKMGAANYLNKNLITPEILVGAIDQAVRRKHFRESIRDIAGNGRQKWEDLHNAVGGIARAASDALARLAEKKPELRHDEDFMALAAQADRLMRLGGSVKNGVAVKGEPI